MPTIIESTQNMRIKMFAKMKDKRYRDEWRTFLVDNEHLIQEALKANLVKALLYVDSHPFKLDPKIEEIKVTEAIMEKLSSTSSTAKYVALCKYMPDKEITGNRIIILDDVQDPGNVGTIIRSAISFGFDGVILSKNGVDLYNDKLIRSTQGALFHLPVKRCDVLPEVRRLKSEGYYIVGTALVNGCGLSNIMEREKMAIVMGNEGSGVSSTILMMSDINAFIEMENFESLNVGVAAGILMYTFRKK
ncbi:MAG: RNA methyltransferase [Erysipelotrichales bacterium]|nr:RNA methyltransferase [Erysipelotrichales bacterium]